MTNKIHLSSNMLQCGVTYGPYIKPFEVIRKEVIPKLILHTVPETRNLV